MIKSFREKSIVTSILMLTITAGLLALNPSIFAQAQPYNDGYYDKESYYKDDTYRYGYDHNDKKKDINIEKIICDNKKINIIGNLDVTPETLRQQQMQVKQ